MNSSEMKPVSPEALAAFDRVRPVVEDKVLRRSLAEDRPEETMGPDAESMIQNGLGFVSKMLRAAMGFAATEILEDQMEWGKQRLPAYGVSADMVLKNFMRYFDTLEQEMPDTAFAEVRPYIEGMIAEQRGIAEDAAQGDGGYVSSQ